MSNLDHAIELICERTPAAETDRLTQFVSAYFAGVGNAEIEARPAEDLYGAAMSHWNLALVRQSGSAKVRVYTPTYERHGWRSVHSIVDIVCANTPFVVDSVKMALYAAGLNIHSVTHPTFTIRRDVDGTIVEFDALVPETLNDGANGRAPQELFIHFEIDRVLDEAQAERIHGSIVSVIESIDAAVADWRPMLERLLRAADDTDTAVKICGAAECAEAKALLLWLHEGNFTLLGYYNHTPGSAQDHTDGMRLGILRSKGGDATPIPGPLTDGKTTNVIVVTKSDVPSRIHRPGYYDYISVRRFNDGGTYAGEHIFIGHFTSTVFHTNLKDIPWVRLKLRRILESAPFHAESHSGRALVNALETLPREALFQFTDQELLATGSDVSRAEERRDVSLFVHKEPYGRFIWCLTLVPRDRFSTQTRDRIQRILVAEFEASDCEFSVQLSASRLARVNFVLRVDPSRSTRPIDIETLAQTLNEATRRWTDKLQDAIHETFGEERGAVLARRYANAFKQDFQEHYSCREAAVDIEKIEKLTPADPVSISMFRPLEFSQSHLKLRLYEYDTPASLSATLETFENMGLNVSEARPSRVDPADSQPVWIHDYNASHTVADGLDIDTNADRFTEAFLAITGGQAEDDALNGLVIGASLSWREVVVLRTYCRYLLQIGVPFSQKYMRETLRGNPQITHALVDLFHTRFDPEHTGSRDTRSHKKEIVAMLANVESLDQDRILRSFLAVILATLRTNFYQHDANGSPKPYVSIKLDPSRVPDLPAPRPRFEIFVYSPRIEGIHLRSGKIARGGLRWSDRREDFRTEILGLLKAQTIKNAVIVPHGAKGGFFPKRLDESADRLAEGIACYKTFIRGLLDITDNLDGTAVIAPPRVVRHDEDDPYLVVAADKGTASFSDIANEIAAEYSFWLDDGFASGGSAGYDHKAMGITAKGAWESVKRHFRELGIDTQTKPFTVIGIGDMAGDVFGNGMLRSPQIKLVAAFNHSHIFIDPQPDPRSSFEERERLFALRGSTWADYDSACLSPGGAVFVRSAKSVTLSAQAREALEIERSEMTPNELINAILQAPVDLLWNGGIGTYVKASDETHADVGDRTNDAVRVDATQLRCRVVGEGGNLGLTQRGRIEFARAGGHIYTDSIDNSAGVDCSDHEVNIKILLNQLVAEGELARRQRDELLVTMTQNVADLVLKTNYTQTQAISLAAYQAASMIDVHGRLIANLERARRIDRIVDSLPDEIELLERRETGSGLTSPELSVLIGHVKLALFDELLESDLPDAPFFTAELLAYFPDQLRAAFADRVTKHRLRREIITNVVVNEIVNRAGITFAFRLTQETGASFSKVARAWYAAREIFEQPAFCNQISSLDNLVPARMQTAMLLEGRKLVERATRWLLRCDTKDAGVRAMIGRYAPGVRALARQLPEVVDTATREKIDTRLTQFKADRIPEDFSLRVACFEELSVALDIVDVAEQSGSEIATAAVAHFEVGAALGLHWLRSRINDLPRANRWQTLARAALREDLDLQERQLTCAVLQCEASAADARSAVGEWLQRHGRQFARCREFMDALMTEVSIDSAMVSAALREVRSLSRMAAPGAVVERDNVATRA